MKSKFFFTAVIVGMLSGVASGATDGAEVEYGREWAPYVTLRGGLLFRESKISCDTEKVPLSAKVRSKNGGFGSGEFGFSFYNERVSVGLELGYFTNGFKAYKETFDAPKAVPGEAYAFTAFSTEGSKVNRFFVACDVTLRKRLNEKAFLYGGVGGGINHANVFFSGKIEADDDDETWDLARCKSIWRLFGQAFAGVGVYLNDNWQLTAGYRLRWMPGSFEFPEHVNDDRCFLKVKQNLIHAAEVGVTYRF